MPIYRKSFREPPALFAQQQTPLRLTLGFLFFSILGILLHIGWRTDGLTWQPLWADEGYSVYFATEAPARLLWLTANDIHPPLYYLLLHGWLGWWATPDLLALRLFSVLAAAPVLGLGWLLARLCFPNRWRPQLLFLLLLLVNPLYLYYSQEVRMYGLALTLSMASTLCCWQWVRHSQADKPARGWLVGYVVTATLSLYTLYYLAFLLLAHLIWVGWVARAHRQRLLHWLLADSVIGLLYLPWVIYAARILIAYVDDKVRSDQDRALDPWRYLTKHLRAFTGGHLAFPDALTVLPWLALGAVIGLLLWALWRLRWRIRPTALPTERAVGVLCLFPLLAGWLVNLLYPFFPAGGERLLLFTLPYFLLLVVGALDDLWQKWLGPLALLLLLATALVGDWVFYTVPRYQHDDYRLLIRQMVQAGTDSDTVLATFPWQVGLWRAYAPAAGLIPGAGPTLHLLSDRSVVWGPAVTAQIDAALARGMLWVPSLLSIGSTLPAVMDAYLADRAVNFVADWAADTTTRLDAWRKLAAIPVVPVALDWGDVQLLNVGVPTTTVPAANFPLVVALTWQTPSTLPAVGVTLRLQKEGHTWAQRDYATLGMLAAQPTESPLREQVGLIVPAGLPPGDYTLAIGLIGADSELRTLHSGAIDKTNLAPIATLTITAPATPFPPFRLPIQHRLAQPVYADKVGLLGYSGSNGVILAGTMLDLTLFWQNQANSPAERHLYLSLLDANDAGVAGWDGWPLPTYPMHQWSAGALVQTPVSFLVPATVASGTYRLVAGLLDPLTGAKQLPVTLGQAVVQQRTANFTPPSPPIPLADVAQFGTHVRLLGYAIQQQNDQLDLSLYWQVLQPIVPAHHLFVHLDNAAGITLDQTDGAPQTAAGLAPTGSWQLGEFLVTEHHLVSPVTIDATLVLRVGLYEPQTEVRLPLTLAGNAAGDAFTIELAP